MKNTICQGCPWIMHAMLEGCKKWKINVVNGGKKARRVYNMYIHVTYCL